MSSPMMAALLVIGAIIFGAAVWLTGAAARDSNARARQRFR